MCTGSRSTPRQGLPGDRQGPPWFLWSHSRTKYPTKTPQDPGKRSLPGRPTKASQGTCRDAPRVPARPGERQASGRDKTTTAARRLPRQGACRGKPPLCAHAPAHPPTCRSGTLPGVRGGRLCSQRCAVASGADKIAIVASGGIPDGPFLHCLGDADRHLMPLSPAVRVRYDTLYK